MNDRGQAVTEAESADPVEILGLKVRPQRGDEFRVFEDEREARPGRWSVNSRRSRGSP